MSAAQYLPVDETDLSIATPWVTCTGAASTASRNTVAARRSSSATAAGARTGGSSTAVGDGTGTSHPVVSSAGPATGSGSQRAPTACAESWLVSVAQGRLATPRCDLRLPRQAAKIAFRAADGRSHQVTLQGYGEETTVPAGGVAASLALTPASLRCAVLVDGTPEGRLTVQVPKVVVP